MKYSNRAFPPPSTELTLASRGHLKLSPRAALDFSSFSTDKLNSVYPEFIKIDPPFRACYSPFPLRPITFRPKPLFFLLESVCWLLPTRRILPSSISSISLFCYSSTRRQKPSRRSSSRELPRLNLSPPYPVFFFCGFFVFFFLRTSCFRLFPPHALTALSSLLSF